MEILESQKVSLCIFFGPKVLRYLDLEKWLDRKVKFIFKIHDAINWETNDYNTQISRNKGNQTMKFGQSLEYNMRNVFPEKTYTKCVIETSSRPFSKKSKLIYKIDPAISGSAV